MDSGKSTLALQTAHNHQTRGRKGLIFTNKDRGGRGVITSRLGLRSDAIEVDPELDLHKLVVDRLSQGERIDFIISDETQFFEALTKLGIETKTKDLKVFYGGAKKGDWDVGLAIDAIRLAQKVDTIILATGDGDFAPLVNYLKMNTGVQVEVVSFGRSTSTDLREVCEDFLDMCESPNDYLINYKRTNNQKGKTITKKVSKKKKVENFSDEDFGIFAGE